MDRDYYDYKIPEKFPVKFPVTFGNGNGYGDSIYTDNFKYYLINGATFTFHGRVHASRKWNKKTKAYQYAIEWQIYTKILDTADFHPLRGFGKGWQEAMGYLFTDGLQSAGAAALSMGRATPYDIEILNSAMDGYGPTYYQGRTNAPNGFDIRYW